MKKLLVIAFAATTGAAFAQLVSEGPFSGALSEGFEGFPNYANGGFYATLPVMGGAGTMDTMGNGNFAVYEPGAASFGLGDRGSATVKSGKKGLGQDYGPNMDFDITFTTPLMRFGGYFNYAVLQGWDDSFDVYAYDTAGNLIGSANVVLPFDDGMHWKGWKSNTGIKRIRFNGDYVVMDDLQADVVPEPATLAVLGLGAAALLRRRRK